MNEYQVYDAVLVPSRYPNAFDVTLAPRIKVTARNPVEALRIAKQKGYPRAVVGNALRELRTPTTLSYLRMGVRK